MIEIDQLTLRVGAFALEDVDLRVESNEYFVVLGPTGSGKTLLLKCICGLERPTSGAIRINGRDVTRLEPRQRNVGYVPQDCDLFPHMNVSANVTFALRARGVRLQDAQPRIDALVDILRIGHLMQRMPRHLSGGERQRVALARALVGKPDVLLLDEPVSALDESTRDRVCSELRRVQRELGVTTMHVSHNLEEAMAVSDRAGVIQDGRLVQAAPMMELLRRPKSEALAQFLRAENIFPGHAVPDDRGGSIIGFAGMRLPVQAECEGEVRFMIRPEMVRVLPMPGDGEPHLRARLDAVIDRGPYRRLEFSGPAPVVAYVPATNGETEWVEGQDYRVVFPANAVHVLE